MKPRPNSPARQAASVIIRATEGARMGADTLVKTAKGDYSAIAMLKGKQLICRAVTPSLGGDDIARLSAALLEHDLQLLSVERRVGNVLLEVQSRGPLPLSAAEVTRELCGAVA